MSDSETTIEVVLKTSKSWPGIKLDRSQRSDDNTFTKAIVADVTKSKGRDGITKTKIIRQHAVFYGPTAKRQANETLDRLLNGGSRNSTNVCVADGVSAASLPVQQFVGEEFQFS